MQALQRSHLEWRGKKRDPYDARRHRQGMVAACQRALDELVRERASAQPT